MTIGCKSISSQVHCSFQQIWSQQKFMNFFMLLCMNWFIESGFIALSHRFMALSGWDRNQGPGHNALLFLIDPKWSCSCQSHRQPHTTHHFSIVSVPPIGLGPRGLNSQPLMCQPCGKSTQPLGPCVTLHEGITCQRMGSRECTCPELCWWLKMALYILYRYPLEQKQRYRFLLFVC